MKCWISLCTRMAIILIISAGAGLTWNAVSPRGLPLHGQWDDALGVVTPSPETGDGAATLQTVEAARLLWEKGAVFIDARNRESYDGGHIKGAVSLSVYEFDTLFFDFIDAYSPDTLLVLYCSGRLCDESHRLGTMLRQEGYESVKIFADGLPAWTAAGLPTEGEQP